MNYNNIKPKIIIFFNDNTDNNNDLSNQIIYNINETLPKIIMNIKKKKLDIKNIMKDNFVDSKTILNNSIDFNKKSNYKDAFEVFPNSRNFTDKEALEYEKLLNDLYIPTGKNFFDL